MRAVDLCGTWDFVADLDPKYHTDTRIYRSPEYARPEENRRHWLKVKVPGVWQTYGARYEIYEGVCWYSRSFDAGPVREGVNAFLRFGGVNYLCRVFLNGAEVGRHEGGYTEFFVAVTGHLRPGTNHIALMVDNRATSIKWPPCLGYFNYGGIHRDVTLELYDAPSLASPVLRAGWDGKAGALRCTGTVLPRPAEGRLEVLLECEGHGMGGMVAEDGSYAVELVVPGVDPWSPESPRLSEVRLSLREGEEEHDGRILQSGFRSLRLDGGRLLLNGSPLTLQGICYVYDSPTAGLVMTEEQLEGDVALMKGMGCNAVRCHYPMDRRFYECCDRMGLLVWVEPPVYCYHPGNEECGTGFAEAAWVGLARGMIEEMIATARAHPSVAIYGIGNECNTANPEAEGFFRSLAERVRSEDPDRLVSYAALYGNVGSLARIVDVLGVNSYYGWYDKIFGAPARGEAAPESVPREPIDLGTMRTMLDGILRSSPENLALLLTEFGADSVAGFRSRARDLWSEDYHAELLEAIFALSREYPRIIGTFPFCFSDYRDPSKVHNGYWNELNLKGVVGYGRQPKRAYDALRRIYAAEGGARRPAASG